MREVECLCQGHSHDRDDHEHRQDRSAKRSRPPDHVAHVPDRCLEAESKGRGDDAELKGPRDELLGLHGSLLRDLTLPRTARSTAINRAVSVQMRGLSSKLSCFEAPNVSFKLATSRCSVFV